MGTLYIQSPELAYVHIPRSGMAMKRIIADWLKPNFAVNDKEDWMINHPNLQMVQAHYPTAKTFTVVRNPWQRLWSFYQKIAKEGYWLDWNDQTLMDLAPLEQWLENYANPEVRFDFPRWFNRFTPMVDFLHCPDGDDTRWVDFILRSEHLESDFNRVSDYLECEAPLPDLSGYDNFEYRKYFNTRCKQLVEQIYAKDIEFFGYIF
jgi:hypothetical protein